jgi:hypothetical protein
LWKRARAETHQDRIHLNSLTDDTGIAPSHVLQQQLQQQQQQQQQQQYDVPTTGTTISVVFRCHQQHTRDLQQWWCHCLECIFSIPDKVVCVTPNTYFYIKRGAKLFGWTQVSSMTTLSLLL